MELPPLERILADEIRQGFAQTRRFASAADNALELGKHNNVVNEVLHGIKSGRKTDKNLVIAYEAVSDDRILLARANLGNLGGRIAKLGYRSSLPAKYPKPRIFLDALLQFVGTAVRMHEELGMEEAKAGTLPYLAEARGLLYRETLDVEHARIALRLNQSAIECAKTPEAEGIMKQFAGKAASILAYNDRTKHEDIRLGYAALAIEYFEEYIDSRKGMEHGAKAVSDTKKRIRTLRKDFKL